MDSASQETNKRQVIWTPQPGPQVDAITADWCPIVLYGGAKFGGKTDFLLGDWLQDVDTYREHWQGIIFRRALTEFTEIKLRAKEMFPKYGATWHEQAHEWRFHNGPNGTVGSILRLKYLDKFEQISLYEGHSYSWIAIDELGDWEDANAFFRIVTLNRYARAPVPTKRIRASCNPGGRGHAWIKEYFIDPAPGGYEPLFDETLQCYRLFIPAKLDDNKIGLKNDPGYEHRLNRAGSPALVRALRYGDWNIVAGAFFSKFCNLNIVRPFEIKSWWTRFESFDPGYSDPFCHTWWAVVSEPTQALTLASDEPHTIPKGSIVCYREWYGEKEKLDGERTRGIKLTIKEHAAGLHKRESGEKITYRVAGHDLWAVKKGPSDKEEFGDEKIYYGKAEITRQPGWRRLADRIEGVDDTPAIYWFESCHKCIQHIPLAQHDKKDAEDVEESPTDHTLDSCRYAVMSRPWGASKPARAKTLEENFKPPTVEQLWAQREQLMKSGRR